MSRNSLYIVIGVLGIAVVAIVPILHERQQTTVSKSSIGDHGISVEKK